MNPAITELNELIANRYLNTNLLYTTLTDTIQTINDNAEVGSSIIIINNDIGLTSDSSFTQSSSDFSLELALRGKDLLLVADQTNQFICTSTDAFSRTVDVYMHINNSGLNSQETLNFDNIDNQIIIMQNYLDTRLSNLTVAEVDETYNTILQLNNDLIAILDIVFLSRTDLTGLIDNIQLVLKTFSNILTVNTTVGIALSISESAWNELKLLSLLNYKSTENIIPQVISNETTTDLESATLTDIDGFGNYQYSFLKDFSKAFLDSNEYTNYKVFNEIDAISILPSLDGAVFNLRNSSTVNEIPRRGPFQLEPVFGYVSFMTQLDLSDAYLESYFNDKFGTLIGVDDFKLEFKTDRFISFYNLFINGLSSNIIIEYISMTKSRLQYNMINDFLKISQLPLIDEQLFENEQIFLNNGQFGTLLNDFIYSEFLLYKGTLNYSDAVTLLSDEYSSNTNLLLLSNTTRSGTTTITKYDNTEKKSLQILNSFEYKINFYHDDLHIYYAEMQINNKNYLLNDSLITLAYNIETSTGEYVFNINKKRKIINDYQYSGYFIDAVSAPLLELIGIKEDTVKVTSENSIGKVTTSTISILSNGLDISKTVDDIEITTLYITDDPVIRITTSITNAYRIAMINGDMDFPKARINSMIGSLRSLHYRLILDDFIDLTWNLNIPRAIRG